MFSGGKSILVFESSSPTEHWMAVEWQRHFGWQPFKSMRVFAPETPCSGPEAGLCKVSRDICNRGNEIEKKIMTGISITFKLLKIIEIFLKEMFFLERLKGICNLPSKLPVESLEDPSSSSFLGFFLLSIFKKFKSKELTAQNDIKVTSC